MRGWNVLSCPTALASSTTCGIALVKNRASWSQLSPLHAVEDPLENECIWMSACWKQKEGRGQREEDGEGRTGGREIMCQRAGLRGRSAVAAAVGALGLPLCTLG